MKRKHFLMAMGVLAGAALTFSSCKKQDAIETPQELSKIEKLAKDYTSPINENYPALKQEFTNLNSAELRTFFQQIYRINSSKGTPAMTEQAYLKQYDAFSRESNEKFGSDINKLSDANLVKVFSTENRSVKTQQRIEDPPPPDPTCEFLPYQFYMYWGDPNAPYSPGCNSWRIVDYYRGDCDGYELTYNGYWNRLRAITPLGQQAIALFLQGDHLWGPARTRVLHKKSSADYWFVNVAGINNNLRMCTEYD